MTEALFLAVGAAAGFLATWREIARLRLDLAAERDRVADLTKLLMSREAPAEYAAYVTPQLPVETFPADAIWDDSGLYYATPESD